MKNASYIVIESWMITELGLSGNSLLVYATIYGFSRDGVSVFFGNYDFLKKMTGISSSKTISTILKCLSERNLIVKEERYTQTGKSNGYKAVIHKNYKTVSEDNAFKKEESNLFGNLANEQDSKKTYSYDDILSIIISILSNYIHLICDFNVKGLYKIFYVFILDLQMLFNWYSLLVLIVFILKKFKEFRIKRALSVLRHLEARNCGFINELPIVSMTVGSMGKKKTTIITDMALSQEVMFRQKALEILTKNDLKFPYFNWILFEKDLENAIYYRQVYNLSTVNEWIEKKRKRFNWDKSKIYNYDYNRYGFYYDDGLKRSDLFDILNIYAKRLFVFLKCGVIFIIGFLMLKLL